MQPREPGESRDLSDAQSGGATPFSEALSQLNDRALRRLLGARAFLRGYDYVRRQAVTDVVMEDLSAKGAVRGTEPEPYAVKLQVTPSGFTSDCSCPAFPKINGHCKHVAALLIALRDQVRPKQPRPEASANGNGPGSSSLPGISDGSQSSSAYGSQGPRALPAPAGSSPPGGPRGGMERGGMDRGGDMEGLGGSRRARRRARKLAAQRIPGGGTAVGGGGGERGGAERGGGRPGFQVEGRGHDRHGGGGSGPVGHASQHGVDAWLPEPMPPAPKTIEYRMQVRPSSLSVSLIDPDARTPLSATSLLQFQAQKPTADRDALRLLARLENDGPRRVGIDVRGEDAADLLPLLEGPTRHPRAADDGAPLRRRAASPALRSRARSATEPPSS